MADYTDKDIAAAKAAILAEYPDARFVATNFGRGLKVVRNGKEFPLFSPSWGEVKVFKRGPRKGQAIGTGKTGPAHVADLGTVMAALGAA